MLWLRLIILKGYTNTITKISNISDKILPYLPWLQTMYLQTTPFPLCSCFSGQHFSENTTSDKFDSILSIKYACDNCDKDSKDDHIPMPCSSASHTPPVSHVVLHAAQCCLQGSQEEGFGLLTGIRCCSTLSLCRVGDGGGGAGAPVAAIVDEVVNSEDSEQFQKSKTNRERPESRCKWSPGNQSCEKIKIKGSPSGRNIHSISNGKLSSEDIQLRCESDLLKDKDTTNSDSDRDSENTETVKECHSPVCGVVRHVDSLVVFQLCSDRDRTVHSLTETRNRGAGVQRETHRETDKDKHRETDTEAFTTASYVKMMFNDFCETTGLHGWKYLTRVSSVAM